MKKLLFFLLLIFSCESDLSDDCCWICKVQITEYNPRPGIKQSTTTITFADSIYCDCPYETIKAWEEYNTYTDTINGIRRVVIAKCKQ